MPMNHITIYNMDNFQQIIDSPIFLGCNKISLDVEMYTNMWMISIDDKMLKNISITNLLDFIEILLEKKTQQLLELNVTCSAIFYMWFDEMASQLRFNVISETHKKLPFSCQLNIIDSPDSILRNFLQSQYHPEIPWDDLEEVTDNTNDNDNVEKKIFILDIFIKQLISTEQR